MSVRDTVRSFIAENFGFRGSLETMTDEDSLVDAGIIDSVAVLVVIQFLEERFGISVADEDVSPENLGSIAGLTRYVESKGGAA